MHINEVEINDGAFIVAEPLDIHGAALTMPPMSDEEFKEFKEDISGNGLIEPIVLFQGKVLDGRNRYNACKELGIEVWGRNWEGGMDPVEYVVAKNLHRRHLTPGQRAAAAARALEYHVQEAKDRQRSAGVHHGKSHPKVHAPVHGATDQASKSAYDNQAISRAGKLFNVSGRTVAAAKFVQDHGTEDEKKALETGKTAVKPLERQVREREKAKSEHKPTFNKTSDSIEWAKWTWNPVTGCLHGCPYCYASDFALRYPDAFPKGFEPTFHPERLTAPNNTKLPDSNEDGNRSVFVCSMADLFGDWVPQEWIDQILDVCEKAPDWIFIFLTKNPKRMVDIKWPRNAWIGTTVDCQARVDDAVEAFEKLHVSEHKPSVMFVSCEPMNERLNFGVDGLEVFDWVIIGGRSSSSGMPSFQPEWGWVETLHDAAREAGCKIYWKPNLTVRPKEYPSVSDSKNA